MAPALVWTLSAFTIAAILIRPGKWPEAVWACLGGIVLIVLRGITPSAALAAVLRGADVYMFLAGMMLLSELARREGLFDWLAYHAVHASRGSGPRLFVLVYGVGILVTVLLSNDATAVVLTPAVYAAVRKARVEPLPYLFACALIANAASFVLPISNPANLVVYGRFLPPLLPWLKLYLLPSIASIAVTFAVLRWRFRQPIASPVASHIADVTLTREGRHAAWAIAITGAVLLFASGLGRDLGLPTFLSSMLCLLIVTSLASLKAIVRGVSWSVLPLVAGLFVVVAALNAAGAAGEVAALLTHLAAWPAIAGSTAAAFAVAGLSNVMNNLPSGLLASGALRSVTVPAHLHYAVLIGVDLGPNLSVTGSLATILWLIVLRREGEHVTGWRFLKVGALAMPPALLLATFALSLVAS